MRPAEVPQNLGGGRDIVTNEDDRGRTFEERTENRLIGVCGRSAHQGVLEDLVVGTGDTQLSAQCRQIAYLEPAVLGEDGRAGAVEMLTHLFYDGDLFRPRTCHERSFDHTPGRAREHGSGRLATRTTGGSAGHFASSG